MGGYNVIECADLDEAIEVASRHPVAKYGSIEVRPLWERGRLVKVVGGRGVSKESFERGLQ
jgi:hypothetical protein